MRIRVQVVIEADGDVPPAVHQVAELRRDALQAETLGLQLAEAKELLARVQNLVVEEQVRACLAKVACPHCGRPRRHKDERSIALRSLFGTLRLPSPRWHHCPRGPWARRKKGMRIEGHHAAAQLLVGVDAELANPYDGQRWATTALDPFRERETQAGRGPSRSVQDSLILTDRRERAPTPASRSSMTGAGRGPYVISKRCPQHRSARPRSCSTSRRGSPG